MKYTWIFIIIASTVLSGCGGGKESAGPAGGGDRPVSVILAKAVREPVKEVVEIVGSISARDEVSIVSEVDSTVTVVAAREGQQVKKGDILFRLDDVKTVALLAEAEAANRLSELSHTRDEGLLKSSSISQQKYDEGEADWQSKKSRLALARDEDSKTEITAPMSGMIGERAVSEGQFVTRGQHLLDLVTTDPLDIVGDIPERYIAGLSNGLEVEFKTAAYPDRVFKAVVIYVSPSVDTASRALRIKAEIQNADALLRPGMFGRMSITLEERVNSLVIPEACIQMQGRMMMAVRVNKEGRSEFVPVTTGRRAKSRVEILSGLSEGDLVIVEGWQKMGPGALVIAAPESEEYGVKPGAVAEAGNDNI